MPNQEHTYPDYEETFRRVATILDVIAQEQAELQRSQAEFHRSQAELQAEFHQSQAELQRSQAETARALKEWIAHSRERDAETTDKLNAVIELMDRHLREK